MVTPPSRKVTVPVAAEGEVVAVRVTLDPVTGVVFDAVRDVVEAVRVGTVTAEEVLAL
jgi:hypothetical protein